MTAIDTRLIPLVDVLATMDAVLPFTGGTLTNALLRANKVTAVLARSTTVVDAALLSGTPVQFVATATSGTDHIDLNWCAAHGITVVDAAGSNANAVAEWLMAVFGVAGVTPADTVGIVGYGHVGNRVARMCGALGISTLVNDPPQQVAGLHVPNAVTLDDLLRQCSVVTLHVPRTTSGVHRTLDLITHQQLALLPKGALVINAARGGVLNEADAMAWIAQGGRVIADTFDGEPNIDADYGRACVLATPHVAGHTLNSFLEASLMVGRAWCAWKGCSADAILKACTLGVAPPIPPPLHGLQIKDAHDVCEQRGILADAAVMKRLVLEAPMNQIGERFSQMRREYPLRQETFLL